ncbi:MAG: heparinase [bacterium]|nr:heparinase [bacterium]
MLVSTLALTASAWMFASAGETMTIEDLCADHTERIERLFAALDLERAGLEDVKEAAAGQDWPAACRALLAYYRTAPAGADRRKPPVPAGKGRDAAADEILDGIYTNYTISAKVPLRDDGGLDWTYNGPDGDREWGWGLNRHPWTATLFAAYTNTGNPVYIRELDRLLCDWVLANPYPGVANNTPQWRGLETYMRIGGHWPRLFYGLEDVEEFRPVTRILMLSSVPDHAHYGRNFHAGGSNWITMELNGLAKAAVTWPEFREADAWYTYAFDRLLPEMSDQVYPDGVQTELTSHYHRVALSCFNRFAQMAEETGRSVPADFFEGVERMNNYLAYAMRPSGYGPLNNDSDLDHTRPGVLAQVDRFKREDWRYIATNGAEGTEPELGPSVVFPWAGQVVMRNGWDTDAHWAFFDVGPLGSGHWHYDKLHLSVAAFGRDILVDSGRYTYAGDRWMHYFKGSSSHNVVLIDGKEQGKYQRIAEAPMDGNYALTPDVDFARGTFDGGFRDVEGRAVHSRSVTYVKNRYWLVVDRIDTDRPRTVKALWHFHPDCTVEAADGTVASIDPEKGNVRITPAGTLDWDVSIVNGAEEPRIQGWWSRVYNEKEPSPCAVFSALIEGPTAFAWVIVPARGPVSPLKEASIDKATDEAVRVSLTLADGSSETIVAPWNSATVERTTK